MSKSAPRQRLVSTSRKLRFAHCSNCGLKKPQALACKCGTETWIGLWDDEMMDAVEVSYSGLHGLGVFATRDIPAWTLIDSFPAYLITLEDFAQMKRLRMLVSGEESTIWDHMIFPWLNNKYKCLVLGNALIYNHDWDSTCLYWYRQDSVSKRFFVDMFTASDVKEGQELTIRYGEEVWFPPYKDPNKVPKTGTLGEQFAHLRGHGVGNPRK